MGCSNNPGVKNLLDENAVENAACQIETRMGKQGYIHSRFRDISRFDRFTNSLWDLEMFFPMTFFWWFVFLGGPRTIPAWLPLRLLWAIFVICINPRWPPADMTKINFGSTCHKMMYNTSIMFFWGCRIHFWCCFPFQSFN